MRLAWGNVTAEYPDVQASIYGGHARNLVTVLVDANKALQFDGPSLWWFRVDSEPGRARAIPPEGFEAVVILGSDSGSPCVFRTYERYHFAGLTLRAPRPWPLHHTPTRAIMRQRLYSKLDRSWVSGQ